MNEEQKVSDAYDIDEDTLAELSEANDYWEKSFKFYTDVKNKTIEELTSKEVDWLDRINDDYMNQWERLC